MVYLLLGPFQYVVHELITNSQDLGDLGIGLTFVMKGLDRDRLGRVLLTLDFDFMAKFDRTGIDFRGLFGLGHLTTFLD